MDNSRSLKMKLSKDVHLLRSKIKRLEKRLHRCDRLEQLLLEHEKEKDLIFKTSTDAIILADPRTGLIINCNKETLNLTGRKRKELIRKSHTVLYPKQKSRFAEKMFQNVLTAKGVTEHDCEVITKNRIIKYVRISSFLITFNNRINALFILRDISSKMQTENRLHRINQCFLSFSIDPMENINKLVKLCGELLSATCAIYNYLEGKMLHATAKWQMPENYVPFDKAQGHICYDVIRSCENKVFVIQNLNKSKYAKTDRNIRAYKLKTYVGKAVYVDRVCIGSLCVVYKHDFTPDEQDKIILTIIANAIGIEEDRMRAESGLKESHQRYLSMFENSPISLWEEDFSQVKVALDQLKKDGVKDIREYFDSNPDVVAEMVSSVRVVNVNMATLKLFKERGKKKFWQGLTSIFCKESYKAAIAQFIAIYEGKTTFECETVNQTLFGNTINVFLKWTVMPGHEDTYSKILVSIIDFTKRKQAEVALKGSEDLFKNLAENSPNIIFINQAGKIEYVNQKCVEIMGYTKDELYSPNFNFLILVAQESRQIAKDRLVKHLKGQQVIPKEYTLITKDGTKLETIISTKILPYNQRNAILGIVTDITEFKKTHKALIREKCNATVLLDLVDSIIVALDENGVVALINKCGAKILGYAQDDIIGKDWFASFLPDDMRESVRKLFNLLIEGKVESAEYIEYPILTKSGLKIISWHNNILRDATGAVKGTLSAGSDITERLETLKTQDKLSKALNKSHKQLQRLVLRDGLTGLYNHRFLIDAIEAEFSRAKRYAMNISVIMLDIDYFKSVNDLYGHKFGDLILTQFAKHLKKMVRSYDITVRFGGEEFVIISPGSDQKMSVALAERILDTVSIVDFGNPKHSIRLSVSIGIVSYPVDHSHDGMEMVSFADKLVSKAKEEGGNRFCISDPLRIKGEQKKHKELDNIQLLRSKVQKLDKRSKQVVIESIIAFAKTMELKDAYTKEHVDRTTRFAIEIAKAMKLPKKHIDLIKQGAMLHDLGKIGIGDKVLLKKTHLTKKEFEYIKKHPQIGADIIRPIQFMQDIIPLIFYHHERWDGKGYPTGLKGEEIPLGARIISIADGFQAITSDRPYRKAYPMEQVLEILQEESGTKYDPDIVKVLLKILLSKNKKVKQKRKNTKRKR